MHTAPAKSFPNKRLLQKLLTRNWGFFGARSEKKGMTSILNSEESM